MPHLTVKTLTAPLLVLTLAGGCGNIQRTLDYIDTAEGTEARISALRDTSNTRFTEMLDLESRDTTAQFTGNAAICAPLPSCANALVGNVTLTANFGTGTMQGTAGDFLAKTASDDVVGVNGTITLDNGVIGTGLPNEFEIDIAGELTGSGISVDVNGDMDGNFKGTPIEGLVATSNEGAITVNGSQDGYLIIGANIVLD